MPVKKKQEENKSSDQIREERIRRICQAVNDSEFGGENNNALTWVGDSDIGALSRFSSGDSSLNEALGGGWPRGRFVEVYGPESGGKTTLCLHAISEFQREFPDEDVALVDAEYSFDAEYATNVGVNMRWLLIHQPEDGQQALNVIEKLIKQGVGLIVVDSVAALTTKDELDGAIGDTQVAQQARMMSPALRRLTAEAGKRNCTVFWTNQVREKIGVTYGDKTTTPAGRALKHYSSIRVAVRRASMFKEKIQGEEVITASLTVADVKKNKTAPPFRKAEFYIVYGIGIDPVVSTFDAALKHKLIDKKGSWFSFESEQVGQGRAAALQALRDNRVLYEKVKALVSEKTIKRIPLKAPIQTEKESENIAESIVGKTSEQEVEIIDV
jgi:recombination protein RecA